MAKKNSLFIILFLSMNLIYVGFVLGVKHLQKSENQLPTITFTEELIEVSVNDGNEKLFEGVSAFDEEDGKINDNIFIYGISTFDENQVRTITYGVFDSDDQLVTASRQMKYTDYTAPRFSSEASFVNLLLSSIDTSSSDVAVKAYSCVDGDVTNKISMSSKNESNKNVYTYTVTDSTGTSSEIRIVEDFNLKELLTNITIKLTDYIVYLNVDDAFNARDYIETVVTSFGDQDDLIDDVMYETNCDTSVAGQYEAKYTISRENGDYGVSKLIIIVE